MWCPVLGEYVAPATIQAAHVFPHSAGQEAMDNLFGRVNRRSELFEPEIVDKNVKGRVHRMPNGERLLVEVATRKSTAVQERLSAARPLSSLAMGHLASSQNLARSGREVTTRIQGGEQTLLVKQGVVYQKTSLVYPDRGDGYTV